MVNITKALCLVNVVVVIEVNVKFHDCAIISPCILRLNHLLFTFYVINLRKETKSMSIIKRRLHWGNGGQMIIDFQRKLWLFAHLARHLKQSGSAMAS